MRVQKEWLQAYEPIDFRMRKSIHSNLLWLRFRTFPVVNLLAFMHEEACSRSGISDCRKRDLEIV